MSTQPATHGPAGSDAVDPPSGTEAFEARLLARFGDGIVHLGHLPARSGRTADTVRELRATTRRRLEELGVEGLWAHQAEAIDLILDGRSCVVATGTASGKSLCYLVPIAEAVADPTDPGTALCLFPTKALARDQLRALGDLAFPGLVPVAYDGDTPPDERTWARRHANVLLSNPEMLHHGLLPHHGRWDRFLMRLRYVVVDELHVTRGVFGTHVAHLLRRLRRLCDRYGSDPTFVFTSATIGSPERLAAELCGKEVACVDDDGSPRGDKLVALVDPERLVGRRGNPPSPNRVTADLVAELVRAGSRTLAFCRSRAGTEVVSAEVARRNPDLTGRVRAYRGGYLANERREIEARLFSGTLGGVIATNALELGVDIGGLDAVVLNGFPGTVASLWQQIGRAGRERQPSVAVVVAGDDQLDRYFLTHPDEVFSRRPEPAVVNTSNPFVLDPHLACAAYEKPLDHGDERWWPADVLEEGVRRLVLGDRIRLRPDQGGTKGYWSARGRPATGVGLRSGSSAEVLIALRDGTLIGTVDRARACEVVHPGAVYLHQGVPHRVRSLDLDGRVALVEVDDGAEYTMARSEVSVQVLDRHESRPVGRFTAGIGPVEVTSRVTGFQRRDVLSGEVLGSEDLDLPPTNLSTRGFWWEVPAEVLLDAGIDAGSLAGTLHAVEHCAIGVLPLFAICDRWDVGGVSMPWSEDLASAAIVLHDGYPGGAGIAELGYHAADRQLSATLEVLDGCGCEDGCPSCVQSPKCGNLNEPLDKSGARALLRTAGFGGSAA